jgi:hypothetical protein
MIPEEIDKSVDESRYSKNKKETASYHRPQATLIVRFVIFLVFILLDV